MSTREVVFRSREAVVKWVSRFSVLSRRTDPGLWSDKATGLGQLVLDMGYAEPDAVVAWRELAHQTRALGPEVYGMRWPAADDRPDWHAALPGNQEHEISHWPKRYCYDINYRSPNNGGEVRLTWELNRLFWLIPVAAVANIDQDQEVAKWCTDILASWQQANPPTVGVNWASPIECSMQVFALVTLEELLQDVLPDHTRRSSLGESIFMRARWMRRFPSRFSSRNNHTLAELAGELVAALAMKERFKDAFLQTQFGTFEAEFRRQHSSDGMNLEQAPHYGLFALEMAVLCTCAAGTAGLTIDPEWDHLLERCAMTLSRLTDSGGHLLCFGDDDGSGLLSTCLSSTAATQWILQQAGLAEFPSHRPGVSIIGDDWYSVCRSDDSWGSTMWTFDHAPLGMGQLAAHGHADTLSIWMSANGVPTIVEAGTFIYHSDRVWRDLFRSTSFHNTISLDDTDSSSMSGAFNWEPNSRARGSLISVEGGEFWRIVAEHDGYLKSYGATHVRAISRVEPNLFRIEDSLESPMLLPFSFHLLLAPDIELEWQSDGWILLRHNEPFAQIRYFGDFHHSLGSARPDSRAGWISDRFLSRIPTTQIVVSGELGLQKQLVVEMSCVS